MLDMMTNLIHDLHMNEQVGPRLLTVVLVGMSHHFSKCVHGSKSFLNEEV